jgi:hypothetical protein
MTKPAIIIVALLTMNAAAQSQTTGDQWIGLCAKGVSALERASCESYARGVADAVLVVQRFSTDMPPICIPPGATGSDLARPALPGGAACGRTQSCGLRSADGCLPRSVSLPAKIGPTRRHC